MDHPVAGKSVRLTQALMPRLALHGTNAKPCHPSFTESGHRKACMPKISVEMQFPRQIYTRAVRRPVRSMCCALALLLLLRSRQLPLGSEVLYGSGNEELARTLLGDYQRAGLREIYRVGPPAAGSAGGAQVREALQRVRQHHAAAETGSFLWQLDGFASNGNQAALDRGTRFLGP